MAKGIITTPRLIKPVRAMGILPPEAGHERRPSKMEGMKPIMGKTGVSGPSSMKTKKVKPVKTLRKAY